MIATLIQAAGTEAGFHRQIQIPSQMMIADRPKAATQIQIKK